MIEAKCVFKLKPIEDGTSHQVERSSHDKPISVVHKVMSSNSETNVILNSLTH